MQQIESESPFLKLPECQQNLFSKKITDLLQTDKQNLINQNPQIQMNKIKVDEIDAYLIELDQMIRLKRQSARDFIKDLQKFNDQRRIIIGISRHKQFSQKLKWTSIQKPLIKTKSSLFNFNILLKFRAEQFPYASMFSCDILLNMLRLSLSKSSQTKQIQNDIAIKWKYDFILKNEKIGQIMILHDLKGNQVFTNIGIRLKLQHITQDQRSFSKTLLQEFGNKLNLCTNLRQEAENIRQAYERSLMFLGDQVFIRRRQPNQWQDIATGKFVRVNQIGNAILENQQGQEEEVDSGYMERKQSPQILIQEQSSDKLDKQSFEKNPLIN